VAGNDSTLAHHGSGRRRLCGILRRLPNGDLGVGAAPQAGSSVTVNAPITINVEGGSRGPQADRELDGCSDDSRMLAGVRDALLRLAEGGPA
jgi:hypothetical protein